MGWSLHVTLGMRLGPISFHILTCVSVEGVSQDPTKHKKGEEFFCPLVVFWY